ncbi:transcriptional regulator with XRE-family HTH domain [Crossiella equi]|uniref:Transcriptional regulator with XRE-family HTH domain n=1 Tax=Crossiella equi TaxID=130796 RepID=A0ABS5AN75_9PSEU|nr:XRE family transcriptional regulator [Crossiella equi]MBP2477639.1 transcriptional regulator with XRE-family HTH domain [Crossiella equi]
MAAGQLGSLAAKLNHLFAVVRNEANGREYSNDFVARELTEAGTPISSSYLWQLRSNKKRNPGFDHIQAIARWFGVPLDYFTDDRVTAEFNEKFEARRSQQREELKKITEDSEIRLIASRAAELSPEGREQIAKLTLMIHNLERGNRGES